MRIIFSDGTPRLFSLVRGWESAKDIEALKQAAVSMGIAHKVILKALVLGIICTGKLAPMAESLPLEEPIR